MNSNQALVEKLKNEGKIESERVENAFLSIDRQDFIPEKYKDRAYVDRPIKISEEATISAPHMIAIITDLLEVEQDSEVLEIGSGSGYQLGIIAEMAKYAIGVEIDERLARDSTERLNYRENVEIRQGSGFGLVDRKFDRILFSCAIEYEDFKEARKHLKEDGIIVAPVLQPEGQVLMKYKNEEVTRHGFVRFVKFIS